MNNTKGAQLFKIGLKSDIFYHSIRLILAGVFIFASIDKILHPQAFAQAVFDYQVLPDSLINLVALILPWLELLVGASLLLNRWMAGVVSIVTILMSIFVGLIFFNLARGLDISCGCFSTDSDETPMTKLILFRDIFFLCLAFSLLILTFYKNTIKYKHQLRLYKTERR
ncbi:MauE/DoxX family redox-associated membrane protein [Desulfobacula sp.]|uniref:MauE/DoxX family redox-associated membrane protein n=1 Tax=Desulfobacula sp. TaxID=2593537 RepID=UPI0026295528|nr:MauE/DoxX family redox-associated membrane protein [Desulfobacula sp.]